MLFMSFSYVENCKLKYLICPHAKFSNLWFWFLAALDLQTQCNPNVTILEFFKTNYSSGIFLVLMLWTHFSTLQSVSWLVQKDIDWDQAMFYKNEVERPTDQIEIFACSIWISQWVLGRYANQEYLKWNIYWWESGFSIKSCCLGKKKTLIWN